MKKSKLLKVVSIAIIIAGILAVFNSISALLNLSQANEQLSELGLSAIPAWHYILTIVCEIVSIAAGVIGITGKTRKIIMTMGIANLVSALISCITSMIVMSGTSGFIGAVLISMIFPALYLLGCAKSKESVN